MKKLLYIISLLIVFQHSLPLQANTPDSLYIQMKSVDKHVAIKVLKTFVKLHIDSLQNECLDYAREAHQLALKIDDDWEIASTDFFIGLCFDYMNQFDSAQYYYELSMKGYQAVNDESGAVDCMNNLGVIHKLRGDYVRALDYQLQALPIRQKLGNTQDICQTYNNLGNLFSATYDTIKAISYLSKGKKIAEKSADTLAFIYIGANLSNLHIGQKQYSKAQPILEQVLKMSQEKRNTMIEIAALNLLAEIEQKNNRDEKSFELASQSMQSIYKISYFKGIVAPSNILGEYYKRKGDYRKSLEIYQNAIKINEEHNLKEKLHTLHKNISEIYELTNQNEKALKHYKQYTSLKDSIYNLSNNQKLASVQYQHELDEKENEKKLLNEKYEKQKLYKDFTYLIVVLLLLIIFMLVSLIYKNKEAKKYLLELNEQNNRMFSLISHDLKGPVGNIKDIFDLIVREEISDPEEIKSIISDSQQIVDSSYYLLENLLNWVCSQTGRITVYPQQITALPLVNEILRIFDGSVSQKKLRIKNLVNKDYKVYADMEMTKSILRNLISNAIKFTPQEGEISISSRQENGNIYLTISDSGTGMDKSTIRKILNDSITFSQKGTQNEKGSGIGLRICRDFLKRNKGKLEIESEVGKGSQFSISLPKP